jgi:uncharacterized protein (TIGR00251 family)|tara:strand:- start:402 stop:659 length:258 start_codon:yes stop_codon:yes gene_type:complete
VNKLIINVKVQTGQQKQYVDFINDHISIGVCSRPIKNQANSEVIKILSELFKTNSSQIKIVYGQKNSSKTVVIIKPEFIPKNLNI